VGADVVEHDREIAVRIGSFDLTPESEEVSCGVAGTSLRRHLAGGDFESGERLVVPLRL